MKVGAGDFTIRVALRHTDATVLDKFRDLPLVVERKLDTPLSVPVYASLAEAVSGGEQVKEFTLCTDASAALYLGPPAEDKLPKDATPGRILTGTVSLGTLKSNPGKEAPDAVPLQFVVPPAKEKKEPAADKPEEEKEEPRATLAKAVLDAKVACIKASGRKRERGKACVRAPVSGGKGQGWGCWGRQTGMRPHLPNGAPPACRASRTAPRRIAWRTRRCGMKRRRSTRTTCPCWQSDSTAWRPGRRAARTCPRSALRAWDFGSTVHTKGWGMRRALASALHSRPWACRRLKPRTHACAETKSRRSGWRLQTP